MFRTRARAGMLAVAGVLAVAVTTQADAACMKPLSVTAVPVGEKVLRVSWKAPRVTSASARRGLTYRVSRAGQVVGQTRKRWMLVRVQPGMWVTIRVGVVAQGASRMRCGVVVKARAEQVVRADLGAPRKFAVRELSDNEVRLRWSEVDGAAGYRVFREGLVVRQVATPVMDITVVPGEANRFQVAAVDTLGRIGPMSRVVLLTTDFVLPRAPSNLRTEQLEPGVFRITWNAAVRGSAPIRAYRVLRNGTVLGQTGDTEFTVRGLEAGQQYRLEVLTVDARGNLSAKSAPVDLSLDPPTPTTGSARAFLLASTDRSFEDFQTNYMKIGRIYPTYYDCMSDTTLTGKDDPRITRWAQVRRVQVLPRINCQRTATLHRILTETAVRSRWLDQLMALVRDNGYDGLNLDFEAGAGSDRAAMTSFVTELAGRLHAEGRLMSMEISSKVNDNNPAHPRSGIFDYPALAAVLDEGLIMTWGYHWATSTPGNVAPLTWIRDVAKYASSVPRGSEVFAVGTPMYGMDWPPNPSTSKPAQALEYDDMQALVARVGATPVRDADSGELHFTYQGSDGTHEVWYLDVDSVATKHAAMEQGGISRTFVWRLGDEDQRVWTLPWLS